MSMNGMLMGLSPTAAEMLRNDPREVSRLTMGASLQRLGAGFWDPDGLDEALQESLPGCLFGWWPGPIRRLVLRRLLPPNPATPGGAPVPPPAASPALDRPAGDVVVGLDDPDDDDDDDDDDLAAALGGAKPKAPDGSDVDLLNLHKDWQVVHWLVARTPGEPTDLMGGAVLGGAEIGEDLGYGPARLHPPEDVAQIAAALASVGVDTLLARYDRRAMMRDDVYSAEAVGRSAARAHLVQLVAFYERHAAAGNAVLLWIS